MLDPNIALVAVTLIGIVVPVLKWFDDRSKRKAEEARALAAVVKTNDKLDTIHTLVNSRLTSAILMITELLTTLQQIAPDDPRVRQLTDKVRNG